MQRGALEGRNLSKRFRIPQREHMTLRGRLLHPLSRPSMLEFDALQDISFDVSPGEFFGIIGRNGSGKSTLLKLIAGIYRSDSGSVKVNGSIASFIELGVGFNMELSGRDNLYINGALLGLSRKEINYHYDAIVEFAELEDFMDLKLRNYSSGMQVRLAFSVALQADADVLLTDEVLAVGDARFQEKCYEVFEERKRKGRTIVFVSHDMSAIQQFCDRVMLMEQGEHVETGPPPLIARRYLQINALGGGVAKAVEEGSVEEPESADTTESADTIKSAAEEEVVRDGAVSIVGAWTETLDGSRTSTAVNGEALRICVQLEALRSQDAPIASFAVRDSLGQVVFTGSTKAGAAAIGSMAEGDQVVVGFEFTNQLSSGTFFLDCQVASAYEDGPVAGSLDNKRGIWRFESRGGSQDEGVFTPRIRADVARIAGQRAEDSAHCNDLERATVDDTDEVLLVSPGAPSNGLLAVSVESGRVRQIDDLPSTGMDFAGDRILRLLQSDIVGIGADLVEYDETGIARVTRLSDVLDVVCLHAGANAVHVVAAGMNSIVSVGAHAGATTTWHAGGTGDAWRLTSVAEHDGSVYASAFGRWERHREWTEHPDEATGVVVRVPGGEVVVEGLRFPHSLTRTNDGWLLGNSGTAELIEYDDSFTERRRIDLGGWVSGIAVRKDRVIVGVSGMRTPPSPSETAAELVVLDRESWREVDRIAVPASDISALGFAPAGLADGIPADTSLADLRARLEAVPVAPGGAGRHLDSDQMRTRLKADVGEAMWHHVAETIRCSVTNLGSAPLATSLPHPVQFGYRWASADGTSLGEGRQALSGVIHPGDEMDIDVRVMRPADCAEAELTLSLVLENVAWFTEVDEDNGIRHTYQFPAPIAR